MLLFRPSHLLPPPPAYQLGLCPDSKTRPSGRQPPQGTGGAGRGPAALPPLPEGAQPRRRRLALCVVPPPAEGRPRAEARGELAARGGGEGARGALAARP